MPAAISDIPGRRDSLLSFATRGPANSLRQENVRRCVPLHLGHDNIDDRNLGSMARPEQPKFCATEACNPAWEGSRP
jgi:hypothetical protein